MMRDGPAKHDCCLAGYRNKYKINGDILKTPERPERNLKKLNHELSCAMYRSLACIGHILWAAEVCT